MINYTLAQRSREMKNESNDHFMMGIGRAKILRRKAAPRASIADVITKLKAMNKKRCKVMVRMRL